MKTGTASIDVNLGNDRFYFSVDKSFDKPAGSPRQFRHEGFRPKKKSPSDLRRNARRLKEFLEKKSKETQHSSSDPQMPVDTTNLSLISETPMTDLEEGDTKSSDIIANAQSEQIPMDTRNSDENKLVSSVLVQNLPLVISPINTPEKDKTGESSKTEEIRLIICAQDRSSAKNIVTKLHWIRQ